MIYTVTLNPAIDYVVELSAFKEGTVNRSVSEKYFCGGKGINVSLVLKRLGLDSTAMGFVAGFTGEAIEENLKKQGVITEFTHIKNGISRINIKLKAERESEINGQGPEIVQSETDSFLAGFDQMKNGDVIVLAGSIPYSVDKDIYEKILECLSGKDILSVVDTSGKILINTLKYRPFLVKPNHIELSEIFGVDINTHEQAIKYAKELQKQGAVNVMVSMAEKGAVLVDENGTEHISDCPQGIVVNSVGAGDSMVAGFLAGYIEKKDYDYALKLGTAAGSATAFSTGLADLKKINEIFKRMSIN